MRVKASDRNSSKNIYLFALADSGNRACSLMAEDTFRKLSETHSYKKVPPRLRYLQGAGREPLQALGMAPDPIQICFYSPDPKEKRKVVYQVTPLIVRNLSLPFLLGYQDLKTLKAVIDPELDQLRIKMSGNQLPLIVPMRGKPIKNECVTTIESVNLKANHETIIVATVPEGTWRNEILISPSEEFCTKVNVLMPDVLEEARKNRKVMMRIWNPNEHAIRIKKGEVIGYANPFADEPNDDVVAALSQNVAKLIKKQRDRKETKLPPEPNREVYKRIYKDLKFDSDGTNLTEKEKDQVVRTMMSFRNALALDPGEIGTVKGVEFSIHTGDAKPVSERCRPLAPALREPLEEQVAKWLKQGVVSPGSGPWSSALVPVRKKNGGWRFAVDYRRLNAITTKDARPVANMSEKLSLLRGDPGRPFKYWASLDLSEAYHSIKVKKEDQDKTAVITPLGLFKFNRMSFGLSGAPQAFHEVVQLIEKGLFECDPQLARTILMYFDDAVMGGHTFQEMMDKVVAFLTQVEKLGLRVQPKKCQIGAKELKWLGHQISESGVKPDGDLVRTMRDWDPPENNQQLAALVGGLNYPRRFIRNFAAKTAAISSLMKRLPAYRKGHPPVPLQVGDWSKECEVEKQSIIKELLSPPILKHPNFEPDAHPFIVSVDTSAKGIGMTLSQKQTVWDPTVEKEVDREVIIAYGSRKLKEAQSKWSAYKLELFGLVTAVTSFKYFLINRKFIVRTDHRGLQWLMKTSHADTPAQCFRWQQLLSDYIFDIEYVPATKMKLPDALSRRHYRKGDMGTLNELMPFRDVRWDDDYSLDDAKERIDDEFWVEVMKKKFGEENESQPLEVQECTCAVTRSKKKAQIDVEDDILEEGGSGPLPAEFLTENESWSKETGDDSGGYAVLKVKKIDDQAYLPTKGSVESAGFDLRSPVDIVIPSRGKILVQTNLSITVPEGCYGRIAPRSGLAVKSHIDVGAGVVDRDYTGNVGVVLFNHGDQSFKITRGDKIAQLICEKIEYPTLQECAVIECTQRGNEGFGSTGMNDEFRIQEEVGLEESKEIAIPEPPISWWILEMLRSKQQEDKGVSKIRELIENKGLWPKGSKQIQKVVGERLGKLMIGKTKNPQEERTARQQMGLSQMLRVPKEDYQIDNRGILVRNKITNNTKRVVLVVPAEMWEVMLQMVHHGEGTFHLGMERTQAVCDQYFWFPGMRELIQKYITGCRQCQDGKRLQNKGNPGMGQTSSRPHKRLREFALDIVEMPKGKHGYQYMLTMLDISTMWMEAWPLKLANSAAICRILEKDVFPRFGEGLSFTCDNGREFVAKNVKRIVERYGGKVYYGTSYHPNSLPVERQHRTLNSLIRMKLQDNNQAKGNWPDYLPTALFTMRCSPDTLTKQSPFQRVYGFQPSTRVSSWLGMDPNENSRVVDPELVERRNQELPDGMYPSEGTIRHPEVDFEDEDRVVYKDGEEKRELTKIQGKTDTYLAEVNIISKLNWEHEHSQARHDQASEKRHLENKKRLDARSFRYYPILMEVVDWKSPLDPESTHSRKLANLWRGPYVVVDYKSYPFTAIIEQLDMEDMALVKKTRRQVYVGDLRPTLQFAFRNRPRGLWTPDLKK